MHRPLHQWPLKKLQLYTMASWISLQIKFKPCGIGLVASSHGNNAKLKYRLHWLKSHLNMWIAQEYEIGIYIFRRCCHKDFCTLFGTMQVSTTKRLELCLIPNETLIRPHIEGEHTCCQHGSVLNPRQKVVIFHTRVLRFWYALGKINDVHGRVTSSVSNTNIIHRWLLIKLCSENPLVTHCCTRRDY